MKNLITSISSLAITEYKTYISYLPIAVLPRSCVLVSALQMRSKSFLKRASVGSLRISAGVSFPDLRAA